MQDDTAQEWPGKADGVPRPPTPAEIDEVSGQQALITDEWAPAEPPTKPSPAGGRGLGEGGTTSPKP